MTILFLVTILAQATTPASCPVPNAQAAVVELAPAPYPESARALGLEDLTVDVLVTVGANGQPLKAIIQKSSDNIAIDNAARAAALRSHYKAAIANCKPASGTVVVSFTFALQ